MRSEADKAKTDEAGAKMDDLIKGLAGESLAREGLMGGVPYQHRTSTIERRRAFDRH